MIKVVAELLHHPYDEDQPDGKICVAREVSLLKRGFFASYWVPH